MIFGLVVRAGLERKNWFSCQAPVNKDRCAAMHCAVLHCIVLCNAALCCVALHWTRHFTLTVPLSIQVLSSIGK